MASLVFVVLHLGPAAARSDRTVAYSRDQVWPAAVRFLVVDERVRLIDKDGDAGYVMFELRDDGKPYRGSLELVAVTSEGRSAVKLVLQIEDRPDWLELAMLGRLERKLRAELGAPAPPPPKPKPPPRDEARPEPKPEPAPPPPEPSPDGPRISPTP